MGQIKRIYPRSSMFCEIRGNIYSDEWIRRDEAGQERELRFDISSKGLDRECELAIRRVMAHVDWRIMIEKYLGGLDKRTFYEPIEYSKEFKEAVDQFVMKVIDENPTIDFNKYTWHGNKTEN